MIKIDQIIIKLIIFIYFSEPEDVHFPKGEDHDNAVYALIINGQSLVHALHTELEYKFVELCTKCK